MNNDLMLHVTQTFDGLKVGQPSFFWVEDQRLFEDGTAFLNDRYCQRGSRSSPRTWKNVGHALRFWFNWCSAADVDWHSASGDDLIDFRDSLKTSISPLTGDAYSDGTIIAYMQPVIAFYDFARQRGGYVGDIHSEIGADAGWRGRRSRCISIGATGLLPSRRPKKGAIRPFQSAELRAFLAALGPTTSEIAAGDSISCRNRLMADWGWAVGLRLSEIFSLKASQFVSFDVTCAVPFEQQALEVVGKGGVTRNVAVPNWLIADTLRYISGERTRLLGLRRATRGQLQDALFLTLVGSSNPGVAFTGRRFDAIVRQACQATGLLRSKHRVDPQTGVVTEHLVANHCTHDLRHTYAVYTYWIEAQRGNSEPWKIIQAQLGHACLQTTIQTYLHFVQLFGPNGRQDIRTLVGLGGTS